MRAQFHQRDHPELGKGRLHPARARFAQLLENRRRIKQRKQRAIDADQTQSPIERRRMPLRIGAATANLLQDPFENLTPHLLAALADLRPRNRHTRGLRNMLLGRALVLQGMIHSSHDQLERRQFGVTALLPLPTRAQLLPQPTRTEQGAKALVKFACPERCCNDPLVVLRWRLHPHLKTDLLKLRKSFLCSMLYMQPIYK